MNREIEKEKTLKQQDKEREEKKDAESVKEQAIDDARPNLYWVYEEAAACLSYAEDIDTLVECAFVLARSDRLTERRAMFLFKSLRGVSHKVGGTGCQIMEYLDKEGVKWPD